MIVRTKSGNYQASNTDTLLEFLGVKKEVKGIQKVSCDVDLFTSVPFCLSAGNDISEGVPWTLSTFDLDRMGERIDPLGWEYRMYSNNPIIEWAHLFYIPAIGKMEGLAKDTERFQGRVFFNDKEYDPFGWAIGQRVIHNVIRAGSVAFRALEIEIPSREDSQDGTRLIFRKQELLEFSICNVPANPYALAKIYEQAQMHDEQKNFISPFWGNLINML
jgi:glycosidase